MATRLNTKLITWLLGAVVVLGGGVHWLHAYQVQRHAGAWLGQAQRAEQEGSLPRSLDCLERYLTYRPQDTDAWAEYALLLDRLDPSPQAQRKALDVLEFVLIRQPDRQDLRRHLVSMAMSLGRLNDAQEHLETMLKAAPANGELEHQLGLCLEGKKEYEQAAAWYEKAATHVPDQLGSYLQLAHLLHDRLEQPQEAGAVLKRMVQANANRYAAYLARARFLKDRGQVEQAVRDINQARQLAPTNAEVLVLAAELAPAGGLLDDTRAALQTGIKEQPANPSLYLALAELEQQAGRPQHAVGCLRRGLTVLPHQPALLQSLCELLVEGDELDQAGVVITQLRKLSNPAARAGYWDARVLIRRQQWAPAARRLESARPALGDMPDWLMSIDLALGQCYARTGEPDRQLAALRRVVARDPSSAPARWGIGSALLSWGRASEAVAEFQQLVKLPLAPPGSWTALARALWVRNVQQPPDQRNWREVEDALEQAGAVPGQPAQVVLLRGDLLAARQEPDQARALLDKARQEHPQEVDYWCALAYLAQSQGQPATAQEWLRKARQQLGDRVELRLAEMRLLASQPPAAARKGLAVLEQDLGRFPPADQRRLEHGLADAYYLAGEYLDARRWFEQLAAREPADLRCRVLLVDLALQAGDEAEVSRWLPEIRRLEGEEGPQWRCAEAARLIARARRGDRQGLDQARQRLAEAARQRPDWARVPLLEAAIDEVEGRQQRAIEDYQHAVDQGERQPGVVGRLARLLSDWRRFGEADRVLRELEDQGLLPHRLAQLAADCAAHAGDQRRAVVLAHWAVPSPSRDYRDRLWLAQLLEAAGLPDEALAILRATVATMGDVPDTWVALVRQLARHDQTPAAEEALGNARRRLGPDQMDLALADCEEALGRREQAEALYQAALQANPDDFVVLRRAAHFYVQTQQPARAEGPLRRLANPLLGAPDEQVAWARRQLALVLAAEGGDDQFGTALAFLERNSVDFGATVEDQRARARVLAHKPVYAREALRLLEETSDQLPLSADDQLALAQLYEMLGNTPAAREHLVSLVAADERNPQYVASYVQALLRWGEAEEAQRWWAKLEQLEPRAPRTLDIKNALLKPAARPESQ